ncbi:hypothetical protein [Persicirhabdus sediminis]|uniref:DUF4129 domain-containing protein n=1 Tax=Persicirhabdus sediminis TaxID=454144 RepID=A0A8J7SH07_9BACT|nr:hypothetical protein [Persicirhabdus sediminis]MBK1789551.1 hypothetical protein [Persicirhabdus sediminis]
MARFSPGRSLNLPVSELEGLKGTDYRHRVALLERNGGEGASMTTFAGLFLEFIVTGALAAGIMFMLPPTVANELWISIGQLFSEADGIPAEIAWFIVVIQMCAITLLEPFYVGSGFALYLNSRTLTEGWDVELAFRRMSERIHGVVNKSKSSIISLIALGFFLMAGWSTNLSAEEEAYPQAKQAVEQVMEGEEFTIHTRKVRVSQESTSNNADSHDLSWLSGFPNLGWLAKLVEIFIWFLVICVVSWIVYLVSKQLGLLANISSGPNKLERKAVASSVMGMDIRPESMSNDPASEALQAWRDGNTHLALSLLYRGSLMQFVTHRNLPVQSGDTERDCLLKVKSQPELVEREVSYFESLTQMWILEAYAQQQTDSEMVRRLCEAWPFAAVEGGRK